MANVLIIKRSAVAAKVPTTADLQLGELAINTYDGKLYLKKDDGTASIVEVGAGAALPQALGTGDSPQFAGINVGNASDTTITRSSAGVLAVEGGIIPKENRSNTFTANQTFGNGTAGIYVNTNGAAGSDRAFVFKTAGVTRWTFNCNTAAESGSNAGSNFELYRHADAGTYIDTVWSCNRATGVTNLKELTLTTDLSVANGGTGVSTLTGIVKGNGTSAFTAAVAGTDYAGLASNNTYSGLQTFSGGINPGFLVNKQNTTGEGGEFYLQKSDTSTLSGNLTFDLYDNKLRIFEGGGTARGAYIDISTQAASVLSKILTSSGVGVDYAAAGEQTIYTSGSGNWTVPSGRTFALVRAWGAGGSGQSNAGNINAAGGGGGAYKERLYKLSDLGAAGASIPYAIGAGGTSVTGVGVAGNPGGNTTFASGGNLLTAYGGGAGGAAATAYGSGGGAFAQGTSGSSAGFGSQAGAGANGSLLWSGGNGGNSTTEQGGSAYFGGGGGGGIDSAIIGAGGSSVYGGAGGSGVNSSTYNSAATGAAPGGGGGGNRANGGSGIGGAGRIEIWVW